MATELDSIVNEIVNKCKLNDVNVSEPLAAFVARTVSLYFRWKNIKVFLLDCRKRLK